MTASELPLSARPERRAAPVDLVATVVVSLSAVVMSIVVIVAVTLP